MSSHVKEILPKIDTNEKGNTNEEAVRKSKLFWFFILKRFIRATIAVVIKQRVLSKKKRKTQRYGADVFLLLSISILEVLAMVLGEKESDTPFKKKESDTNEEGDTNKVAKYKSILFRVFLVQIGLLALINVDAIKLIQRHGYCADAFLLLFITILGVLAVVLGHIGSSQNRTLYLKIYLILTIISMSIRFVTTDDKLSEVFYNEDVQTYKIYKAILETLMPILATIFTLPLIRKLSSSSICHYYKNE